jgi:sec-independent protein translocase protein TatA
MGHLSIWHWLIVLVIVLLLFGRGRIADIMGDMAKGVKNFRKGLSDDETETAAKPTLDHSPAAVATASTDEKSKAS